MIGCSVLCLLAPTANETPPSPLLPCSSSTSRHLLRSGPHPSTKISAALTLTIQFNFRCSMPVDCDCNERGARSMISIPSEDVHRCRTRRLSIAGEASQDEAQERQRQRPYNLRRGGDDTKMEVGLTLRHTMFCCVGYVGSQQANRCFWTLRE